MKKHSRKHIYTKQQNQNLPQKVKKGNAFYFENRLFIRAKEA